MRYSELFEQLRQELAANDAIDLTEFEIAPGDPKSSNRHRNSGLDPSIEAFYAEVGSVRIRWQSVVHDDPDVAGSVKLLPLDTVLMDWKDDIYFEDDDPDEARRFFHPVDFFAPEAAAGIQLQPDSAPGIHYFAYHDAPIPLNLALSEYVDLLVEARGFLYWQKVIASWISGSKSEEVRRFRKFMPQLFPEFDLSSFKDRYMQLAKQHRRDT